MTKHGDTQSVAGIRPLVVGTTPQAGESLSSVLVRACESNVFTKTEHLLDLIGIRAQASEAIPFTHVGDAPAIAMLLGTSINEIESRMHPSTHDDLGRLVVCWYGSMIERRHLESTVRRFAPRSLEQCEHVQAIWSVRLLDYCPTTMEQLLSECLRCGRSLGWRACHALLECEKCGASLLHAESRILPPALHNAADLGAALVSPNPVARQSALASLPAPFNLWPPTDALEGIMVLGEAQLWLATSGNPSSTAKSAARIAAGIDFARDWPTSLTRYVKAATERSNSTSIRSGLGPLSRQFGTSARKTPVCDLLRTVISNSLGEAHVPAKVYSGATVHDACRAGMLSTSQASSRLKIKGKRLQSLEGRSETFIVRHNVRGGAALYDESAISRLAGVLNTSETHNAVARLLGIPRYCVDAFVAAGLIEAVSDQDANLVTGSPLVSSASITALRERFKEHAGKLDNSVTLREAMWRNGDPHDWVAVFKELSTGRIRLSFVPTESTALCDNLMVGIGEITNFVSRRCQGPGIDEINISCIAAAEIIGSTAQFVSAAVKTGFINGQVGLNNSVLPLSEVLRFQKNYMISSELRKAFNKDQKTISALLRKWGLKPVVVINRVKVWLRADFENYSETQKASLRRSQCTLMNRASKN